jgi:hypothetical protein
LVFPSPGTVARWKEEALTNEAQKAVKGGGTEDRPLQHLLRKKTRTNQKILESVSAGGVHRRSSGVNPMTAEIAVVNARTE